MGCAQAKLRKGPMQSTAAAILLGKLAVVEYGVLGRSTLPSKEEIRTAPDPDGETLIVDPCSARLIQTCCPGDAGGAAGAIYAFLGIRNDRSFPPDVVAAIAEEGDVGYHRYGYPTSIHVIHAAAFDLRGERGNSLDKVTESLALLYERVLLLASKVGRKTLRIPPISTGIYSGSLFSSMPQITATAFGRALQRQAADSNFKAFAERVERVEICLYDSSLVKAYEMSFDTLKTQVGESTPQRVRH